MKRKNTRKILQRIFYFESIDTFPRWHQISIQLLKMRENFWVDSGWIIMKWISLWEMKTFYSSSGMLFSTDKSKLGTFWRQKKNRKTMREMTPGHSIQLTLSWSDSIGWKIPQKKYKESSKRGTSNLIIWLNERVYFLNINRNQLSDSKMRYFPWDMCLCMNLK